MPAHFDRKFSEQCAHGSCTKAATGTLRNARNEVIGPRCERHGEADAKALNEEA